MMAALTTLQCPQCLKVFITQIHMRDTLVGKRPTLIYPYKTCNGAIPTQVVGEVEECGFNFEALQVESFDIPVKVDPNAIITKP